MTNAILQQNIAKTLGIDTLSAEEQAAFLSEIGDVIFETALVRLVTSLLDDEQIALEQYLETEPEPEVLLAHLLEHYKIFQPILEEVVIEFKEDAIAVLKDTKKDIEVIDAE